MLLCEWLLIVLLRRESHLKFFFAAEHCSYLALTKLIFCWSTSLIQHSKHLDVPLLGFLSKCCQAYLISLSHLDLDGSGFVAMGVSRVWYDGLRRLDAFFALTALGILTVALQAFLGRKPPRWTHFLALLSQSYTSKLRPGSIHFPPFEKP